MALASLTIDLTANLSRFEGDLGRASQIATRESERIARSRQNLMRQLEREVRLTEDSKVGVLAMKAAYAGLGAEATKYLDAVTRASTVRAPASAAGVGGAGGEAAKAAAAETAANDRRIESQRALILSISKVSEAFLEQQKVILQGVATQTLSPEIGKLQIEQAKAARDAAIQDIRAKAAQEAAAQALAEEERQTAETRRAAAQRIIDAQNGLTSTYRSQLAALRELRDAGALSPQQFRQAGQELVAKQPASQDRRKALDEERAAQNAAAEQEKANVEARREAARRLIDIQNGLTATYRQQIAALRELRDAGAITQEQFKRAGTDLVARQPVSQDRRKSDDEAKAALEVQQREALALAETEKQTAEARRIAAQKLIDQQNGLTATYRQQLTALRELRDAGAISPAQFRQAGSDLASRQPAVQQRAKEAEEARAAAEVIARQAKEAADAEVLAAQRRKAALEDLTASLSGFTQTYRRSLATLEESFRAGEISLDRFQQLKSQLNEQQNPIVQQYRQEQAAAKKAADDIAASAKRKADAEQDAAARFVQSLQQQANAIGKTRSELLLEEAARRGVTDQARTYIDRIDSAERNLNKFGRATGVAKYQLLTLQYTISDVAASLASGISPFTILLQQGGQVADVFANNGGIGALFRTIGSVFTVARVAIGGTAAAVGALAFAGYKGAEGSKQLLDAVVLSGNAAGVTEAQFNRAARAIAASGEVSVSAAREYGQALIQTGQVGAKNLEQATEVAARFGTATGKSAKEVAAQFATLNSDVSQGAAQLNQNLNFLTAAQLQQIRTLQEQGRSTEATAVVYTALNDRLKQLEPNLGTLDRALRSVSTSWSSFWDRAFDIGRTETIDQKIEKARQALENARNIGTERASQTQLDPQRRAQLSAANAGGFGAVEAAEENLRLLNRSKQQQEEAAAAAAELVKLNKAAANADEFVRGEEKRAKAAEGLARALAEANKAFAAQDALAAKDANYKPSSAETRAAILAKIREDFTDKSANTESNQVAKAQRDAALKAIQDSLKQERDLYEFQNQYLNGLYAQGQVSLDTFYATRRAATERDTQEQLNAIDEQIAVQQRYLDFIRKRDPSEAVGAQKNIDSLNEQAAAIVAERQRKVVLSNLEEAASYKQLQERVVEYRAQLLQLQGDEAGAANLRAAQAIEQARLLARQSQGTGSAISDDELRRQERAINLANQFAEVQRANSQLSSEVNRVEEYFRLRATQSGANLQQTEEGIYLLRQRALEQLGGLVARANELAAASTDPKIQQFAADLALQYAKAADSVDPTLERLREAGVSLGDSLGESFGRAIKEARSLNEVIKDVINEVKNSVVDFLIVDPIKATLRGAIRQSIDAGALQRFGGTSGDSSARNYENGSDMQSTAFEALRTVALSSQAATTLQTSAITSNTVAMTALSAAATQAATALAAISAGSATSAAPSIASLFGGSSGAGIDYNFGGAGFPLADGANRIPYDGFKATLHRDEAVVPAKYNPAVGGRSSGAGGALNVTIENNAGAEVTAERSPNGDLRVLVNAVKSELQKDVVGGGSFSSTMRQTFGLGRSTPRRN